MQAECTLGDGYEHLATGGDTYAALEIGTTGLESSPLFSQIVESAGRAKSCGLTGYDEQRSPEEDEQPQENPMASLKPDHQPERSAIWRSWRAGWLRAPPQREESVSADQPYPAVCRDSCTPACEAGTRSSEPIPGMTA